MQDVKAEERPPRLYAFGKLLPKESPPLRFRPPRNFVRQTWLECQRVPHGLDSMETVWGGIENLRSTIAFSNWLKKHPEIEPPIYLAEKGLMKIDYQECKYPSKKKFPFIFFLEKLTKILFLPLSLGMQKYKGFEKDIADTESTRKFNISRKGHNRRNSA